LKGWVSVTSADGDVLLAAVASKKTSLLKENQELAKVTAELEGAEKKTLGMCMVAYCLFPWRILAHLTPGPAVGGGWPCFAAVLLLIGMTTIVICDLAGLFGCAMGIANSSIALVFIACGTSLPDLYASRSAAIGDKNADSAVGNVMGSNAVNVFFGLGLPWTVASIYWWIVGPTPEWFQRYA
jgi:solute carrier family 8 (sodium/calcium exchanger)